jgi:hypothetical protein
LDEKFDKHWVTPCDKSFITNKPVFWSKRMQILDGNLIGEIALAIEMGADAVDIGKTIHPHPTLGESIGMAAEVAHGSCTDLPPTRR